MRRCFGGIYLGLPWCLGPSRGLPFSTPRIRETPFTAAYLHFGCGSIRVILIPQVGSLNLAVKAETVTVSCIELVEDPAPCAWVAKTPNVVPYNQTWSRITSGWFDRWPTFAFVSRRISRVLSTARHTGSEIDPILAFPLGNDNLRAYTDALFLFAQKSTGRWLSWE
jgi:hypothetical protein